MTNENIQAKYELKKEGLKLEKTDIEKAISFYKNLISDSLFFDDYYQFKRLTVCYHKKKDYQSEAEIIRYFLKNDIPCNKYQFYSFKYKLEKLVKRTSFTFSEVDDLLNYFIENTFKVNYDENLQNPPAERIIKSTDKIEEISEDEMIRRYKKGFLESIADGLYHDRLNNESYDLYVKMIYEYKYISFRYYQRLCSIYRRTKNYKHELMVIKEYFEENSIKKSKNNEKWFRDRLESTKELIGDDEVVDSILNSKYEKAAHLKTDFELNDLDANHITEENISSMESKYENIDYDDVETKYRLKLKALDLEEIDIYAAIDLYKEFINDKLFENDYYPYRRLVMLYGKTKQYKNEVIIIRDFFKSGIYCNNHQFLWFRNKLRKLSKKGYVNEDEITELENIFKNNGLNNKELVDKSVIIAERLKTRYGQLFIQTEEKYDNAEKTRELEEIASEFNRQKNYEEAIKIYEMMIYELNHRSYRYYQRLCYLYRYVNNPEKELEIIKQYYNGNSTKTKHSNEFFEKRLLSMREFIDLSEDEISDILSVSQKENKVRLHEDSDSEIIVVNDGDELKIGEENKSLAKSLGIKNEFSHILSIMEEYDIDLEKPINIYPYDDSLSESENINRKFYLKEFAKALDSFKLYDDLINLYKIYTKNDYFANDWYPYRQLCITYKKTKDYEATLENIKELFLSGIWLNDYQYIWFTNKIRLLKEHIDIDESQVQSWLDFYNHNGEKNKNKINYPTVLADRMKLEDDKIYVQSEEAFDLTQNIYHLEETGRILENKEKYDYAVSFYQEQLKSYLLYKFYKRTCICLEKLGDYESELDCIKEYYQNPPKDVTYESDTWFKNRLKKVNKKLGTDFSDDDLKIKNKS